MVIFPKSQRERYVPIVSEQTRSNGLADHLAIPKSFEDNLVVNSKDTILLQRFLSALLPEIGRFIDNDCTLKLKCEEMLYPSDKEILSRSRRIVLNFKGRLAVAVEKIQPLLEDRSNIK
jgi:hypothetical protein